MENSYVLQLKEPKFKEFQLCFCGYSKCDPLHSYGWASRQNYIIHYVLSGKGIYRVRGKKYELAGGQGFLIEPDEPTFYQADKEDPWSYLWIGFGGTGAKRFLRDIGLNSQILTFQTQRGEELKEIVLAILEHPKSTVANLYFLQGKLYEFFSVLAEETVIGDGEEEDRETLYIQEAISYIRNGYSEGITIEKLAEYLGINRSYLYTVFKNKLGMTPKEFLTKFQISKAKEQLTLTDALIDTIAASCGFRSTIVFSRTFKQQIGMTPTEYRKRNRSDTRQHLVLGQKELENIKAQN